jgi:hypothetical protein
MCFETYFVYQRTSNRGLSFTGYETAVSIIKALGWFLARIIVSQDLSVNTKDYYLISVFHKPRTKRAIIAHYNYYCSTYPYCNFAIE